MTLIPPKKKDNPKLSKQYKKKNEVIKDDPKQNKYEVLIDAYTAEIESAEIVQR